MLSARFVIATCLLLSATAPAAEPRTRLVIAASIAPLHSLLSNLTAGTDAEALLLLPARASEHDAQWRPSQAQNLARANLVFWVGPALETALVKPLANARARSVALADAIAPPLLPLRSGALFVPEAANARDPHFWLDPQIALAVVELMQREICAESAALCPLIRANAKTLRQRLNDLQREISAQLQGAQPQRPALFLFHDATQYFERRFGLAALGALVTEPDAPASARHLRAVAAAMQASARKGQRLCLLSEPGERARKLFAAITPSGADVRNGEIDPAGLTLTPSRDLFFTLMRNLGASFARCYKRET